MFKVFKMDVKTPPYFLVKMLESPSSKGDTSYDREFNANLNLKEEFIVQNFWSTKVKDAVEQNACLEDGVRDVYKSYLDRIANYSGNSTHDTLTSSLDLTEVFAQLEGLEDWESLENSLIIFSKEQTLELYEKSVPLFLEKAKIDLENKAEDTATLIEAADIFRVFGSKPKLESSVMAVNSLSCSKTEEKDGENSEKPRLNPVREVFFDAVRLVVAVKLVLNSHKKGEIGVVVEYPVKSFLASLVTKTPPYDNVYNAKTLLLEGQKHSNRVQPKKAFKYISLYWHFVDVVWVLLFFLVYVCV